MWRPENAGRKWIQEDYINLLEMIDEGYWWDSISMLLKRSESACKLAYGRLRLIGRLDVATVTQVRNTIKLEPLRKEQ